MSAIAIKKPDSGHSAIVKNSGRRRRTEVPVARTREPQALIYGDFSFRLIPVPWLHWLAYVPDGAGGQLCRPFLVSRSLNGDVVMAAFIRPTNCRTRGPAIRSAVLRIVDMVDPCRVMAPVPGWAE